MFQHGWNTVENRKRLSNACLGEADCPDFLVIYGGGQASPFLGAP